MFLKPTQHIFIGLLMTVLLFPHISFSQMQSTNYQLESDSLNFGGGYASSSSYQLQDTVGEIATGNSTSTNYQMRAGYQQMNTAYIAINGQSLLNLGNSPGISVSNVSSSTVVNVITDSYGGYQLTIRSSSSPALHSNPYSFSDYTPASVDPDFLFTVDPNESAFGFSVSGTDALQKFKNDGVNCNAGSNSTPNRCWVGFATTTMVVAERHSSNHPLGTDTSFHYQAGIGSSKIQEAGVYQADLVITATAL